MDEMWANRDFAIQFEISSLHPCKRLLLPKCFWHGLGWICVTYHVKEEKLLKTYHSIPFFNPKYYNMYTNSMPLSTCHTKQKYTKWSRALLAVILMTSGILIFITNSPHHIQIQNDTCLYAYYAHIEFNVILSMRDILSTLVVYLRTILH